MELWIKFGTKVPVHPNKKINLSVDFIIKKNRQPES
jgi:hypothetical protein